MAFIKVFWHSLARAFEHFDSQSWWYMIKHLQCTVLITGSIPAKSGFKISRVARPRSCMLQCARVCYRPPWPNCRRGSNSCKLPRAHHGQTYLNITWEATVQWFEIILVIIVGSWVHQVWPIPLWSFHVSSWKDTHKGCHQGVSVQDSAKSCNFIKHHEAFEIWNTPATAHTVRLHI